MTMVSWQLRNIWSVYILHDNDILLKIYYIKDRIKHKIHMHMITTMSFNQLKCLDNPHSARSNAIVWTYDPIR